MITGLSALNTSFTQRTLQNNQLLLNRNIQSLASGLRINQAADDAAGLAVLSRLNMQTSGEEQAVQNLQDAYSMAQVAEGGLQEIGSIQGRLRELAVQAANDTLTNDDRALIQEEADQLMSEVDRMAQSVSFNDQQLFNGEYAAGTDEFSTQAGANPGEEINLNFEKVDTVALGIDNIDLTTQSGAENAIQAIDESISSLSSQRATIGAFQNRVESAINFNEIQRENTLAASSRIGDTDYAAEMINFTKNALLQQSSAAMLAQGNLLNNNVLSIVQ